MTDILARLRQANTITPKDVDAILRVHNKAAGTSVRKYAKKQLMPYFLKVRNSEPEHWASWGLTSSEEKALVAALRLKPRRTASGVATITVITKPWPCGSNCVFCPNDLRMPKSYLHNEPACQRAERNYFDPYLQVITRLRTLTQMGHVTDKVELIILGGTWSDYPESYQIWFVSQLFAALNDAGNMAEAEAKELAIRQAYDQQGFTWDDARLTAETSTLQQQVNAGKLTYNQAFSPLYRDSHRWQTAAANQTAAWEELEALHTANENAQHRCVGMVIETRPDNVTAAGLTTIRRLGCTKVQMGIQSTHPELLEQNNRHISLEQIQRAFELTRLFGFKSHAHFMCNLYGSNPEADKADYQRFVTDPIFCPDEIKLYPCVLLEGTQLERLFDQGLWAPYPEDQLRDVLAYCVQQTPPYTRISRMIRDFSAPDIIAGNKKTNLRQMIDQDIQQAEGTVQEIRSREVGNSAAPVTDLRLETVTYQTTATTEKFLQWVTPDGRIAGFLRLSLPKSEALAKYTEPGEEDATQGGRDAEPGERGELAQAPMKNAGLPISPSEAMIREVHVYGKVAAINAEGENAQHTGLGKKLIAHACQLAREAGYMRINVISAIGTREYYRARGFSDHGLYQQMEL